MEDEQHGVISILREGANTGFFISSLGLGPEIGLGPRSPNVNTFLTKSFRYKKGGFMSVVEHIKDRHWFNASYSNVSRFTPGTSSATISGYIRSALKFGRREVMSNGSVKIRYDVGRIIGTGSDGVSTSELEMFLNDGWPKTAYPVH
jgi:hypothetical protein